jgi:FMN phosphatase YigB (HAD superfamily)
MRILSDFDGVFTNQDEEAAEVGRRLAEIVSASIGDASRAARLLAELREEVRASPARHGWFSAGEIACYADEDPYVENNAVAAALFAKAPADVIERMRAAGFAPADDLSSRAFEEGTTRWRATHAAHLLPEALTALGAFAAAGAEVVIVSNSSTERIEGILRDAGFDRFGQAKPRIRGGAKKFVLGEEPRALPREAAFGGRAVRLRRPHYHKILSEEQPDVVIGDVLSLDVALPAALRDAEDWLAEARIVLKKQRHTPAWALEACRARHIEVVDSIAALPKLVGV